MIYITIIFYDTIVKYYFMYMILNIMFKIRCYNSFLGKCKKENNILNMKMFLFYNSL